MSEPEVILAIIGVLGTTVGFLGWIIREQFNFNKSNIKDNTKVISELSEVLKKVHKSFDDDRVCRQEDSKQKQEFQNKMLKSIDWLATTTNKISTTQDVILNRQLEYGEDIVLTKETVVTTIAGKKGKK